MKIIHFCPVLVVACFIAVVPLIAMAEYRPSIAYLKDHTTVFVSADGTAVHYRDYAKRIETQNGIEIDAEVHLPFIETMGEVEVLEAWTETPDGRRIDVLPEQIRTVSENDGSESTLGDGKEKVIIFPEVAKGVVLHYRAKITEHQQPFAGHFFMTRAISPHYREEDFRLRVEYDPRLALKFDARDFEETVSPTPSANAGWKVREFSHRQTMVVPFEPNRVWLTDFAPMVTVTSFADYAALGRAYQERAIVKAAVTESIAAQAKEITAGLATERDKVMALHGWVSHNIRYVDSNIGVGGWTPHPAAEVLQKRWGDCKDHVVLFEALLRAVNIESSPALINASESYTFPKLAASVPFNHVITYIPSLHLFLDSTARYSAKGVLPHAVSGKPTLITATGEVLTTPASSAERDKTITRTVLQVQPDGHIRGESVAQMFGQHEYLSRLEQAGDRDREQDTVVDELLARFQETGEGEIESPDPTDFDAKWVVKAHFTLDPVANVPGPSAMTVPVGVAPGRIRDLMTEKPKLDRRFPSTCTSTSSVEETEIRFPKTVTVQRVPPDVDYAAATIKYSARYARTGNTVTVHRMFSMTHDKPTCDVSDDRVWQAFLPVLQRDLRGQVFFK